MGTPAMHWKDGRSCKMGTPAMHWKDGGSCKMGTPAMHRHAHTARQMLGLDTILDMAVRGAQKSLRDAKTHIITHGQTVGSKNWTVERFIMNHMRSVSMIYIHFDERPPPTVAASSHSQTPPAPPQNT